MCVFTNGSCVSIPPFLIHWHFPKMLLSLRAFLLTSVHTLHSRNISTGLFLPRLLHGYILTYCSLVCAASRRTCIHHDTWSQMINANLNISRSQLWAFDIQAERNVPFPPIRPNVVYSTAVTSRGGALAVRVPAVAVQTHRGGAAASRAEPSRAERNGRDQQLWRRRACGGDSVERNQVANSPTDLQSLFHRKGKHARMLLSRVTRAGGRVTNTV